MPSQEVHKLHMAVEQLEDALVAFFAGRFHSATVLAGAAEQLFAGYVLKHGGAPAWVQEKAAITKIANGLKALREEDGNWKPTTEKDIGELLNRVYNASKHAGSTGHTVVMDARAEAHELIDRAIMNFDAVTNTGQYDVCEIPLAQRFRLEEISDASEARGSTQSIDTPTSVRPTQAEGPSHEA